MSWMPRRTLSLNAAWDATGGLAFNHVQALEDVMIANRSLKPALIVSSLIIVLLSLVSASVLAQPAPDAEPGAPGVAGALLGSVEPVAAPGFRLEVTELTWAPDAYVTRHFHPLAIVVCVQQGALGFAIQDGAATLTRGGDGETPETTEALHIDSDVVLAPRDCISFDEFAAHTIHTAWNASDGETVTWESDLVQVGQPFTTFVNDMGTPAP